MDPIAVCHGRLRLFVLLTTVKCLCRFLMTPPPTDTNTTVEKHVQHTRDSTNLACKRSFSRSHLRPTSQPPLAQSGADLYNNNNINLLNYHIVIYIDTQRINNKPQRYHNLQQLWRRHCRQWYYNNIIHLLLKHIIIITIHRGSNYVSRHTVLRSVLTHTRCIYGVQ